MVKSLTVCAVPKQKREWSRKMFKQLKVKKIDENGNEEPTLAIKPEINELEKNEKELNSLKPEFEEREKNYEIIVQAVDCWLKSLNHYIRKDTRVYFWILNKYIVKQLDKLSIADCERIINEFDKNGVNSKLGDVTLNNETLKKWALEYKKEEAKIYVEDKERIIRLEKQKKLEEARRERERIEKKRLEKEKTEKTKTEEKKNDEDKSKSDDELKKDKQIKVKNDNVKKPSLSRDWFKNLNTDKETKIEEYLEYFKSLNKAQKQIELKWFKKKIISKITKDEEEAEEIIHELELLALED